MGVLIAAATLLVGFTAAYVASDDVRYLTRAGIEAGNQPALQTGANARIDDTQRSIPQPFFWRKAPYHRCVLLILP